jgi:hypothetical protein
MKINSGAKIFKKKCNKVGCKNFGNKKNATRLGAKILEMKKCN